MEHLNTLPAEILRYIAPTDKPLLVWETYLKLLSRYGLHENFPLRERYEMLYLSLQNHFRAEYGTQTAKDARGKEKECWKLEFEKLDLIKNCKPKTLQEQINNCKPWVHRKTPFSFPFTNRNYPIIIGFLAGFTAAEVNELLLASNLPELHGRNLLDCVYIYCLNNNFSYEHAVLHVMPLIAQKAPQAIPSITGAPIATLQQMQEYVQGLQQKKGILRDAQEVTVFTLLLTNAIMDVETQSELLAYVALHQNDFAQNRNMPRFYLCDRLLSYIEKNHASANIPLSQLLQKIWCEFLTFYADCVITKIADYDTVEVLLQKDDFKGARKGEGNLLEYVQGTRPLPRKIYILLLIFLGINDLAFLDDYCINCGFAPIGSDDHTVFDLIILRILTDEDILDETAEEAVINPAVFQEKLEEIMRELSKVKSYTDWLFLREKIDKAEGKHPSYQAFKHELNSIEATYFFAEEIKDAMSLKHRVFALEQACVQSGLLPRNDGTRANLARDRRRYLENPLYLLSELDL